MQVTVLFFGQIKDITGNDSLTIADVRDTDTLISTLQTTYPSISGSRFAIAVDKNIIKHNTTLQDKCTVALMPAFSGG